MKRSSGGGILLHRHITPLPRHSVVYFCSGAHIGAVDEETIRKYIESQQWEDPGENFKITAPSEP
jgi:hypothetical protein